MTELLAPAGSFAALKAALANGATAVYLGGKTFSARAFADNFTLEEIREAVKLAHFWDAKVYVALNTLVADEEMMSAIFYAGELYRAGVDAVIVQDIGLLRLLRIALPQFAVHASTQMSIHNAAGCQLLKTMGVERVILARELSLQDIELIRRSTDIGLETFVHGALCVCYSGQCLFSSMVGGRSGNRGRCAQPCRMSYTLVDELGTPVESNQKGSYLLSPRDLVGYPELERLYHTGMDAWKIEGRMKKPEYVATVCRIYSEALRQLSQNGSYEADENQLRQLLQVFNRDQSTGYWLGNPGAALMSYARPNNRGVLLGRIAYTGNGRISIKLSQPLFIGDMLEVWVSGGSRETITVKEIYRDNLACESAKPGETVSVAGHGGREGDRVFKIFDAPLMETARASFTDFITKPLHFQITAKLGQPLRVRAFDDDGYQAEYSSEYVVSAATTSISDMTSVRVQLGRLGGTGYALGELAGVLDQGIILPSSVLNKCRRELVADILQQREAKDLRQLDKVKFALAVRKSEPRPAALAPAKNSGRMQLSALVADQEQAQLAASRGIRDIYFDAVGFAGRAKIDYRQVISLLQQDSARLIPYLPQIILPHEEKAWEEMIRSWQSIAIDAVVANNLGQFSLLRNLGWQKTIYAGMGFNCFNSRSCLLLGQMKIKRVTLSPEMTMEQLRQLRSSGLETEVFAQGAMQLMVSEYCAAGALCGGRYHEGDKHTSCTRPCRKPGAQYYLRDEKGFTFPLRFDRACRMHVFNSRQHCLLKEIPELAKAGIDRLLLDLRLYPRPIARRLLDLYRMAVSDSLNFAEAKTRIDTVMQDYTKGHLYRGVE